MQEVGRRILEDLSGEIQGEIAVDALTLAMYASDASLHQVAPHAVAFPRSTEDVACLARYASETGTPLVARGAGSGLAGESLGAGLLVDFSRYMTAIGAITESTVRVEPGVVCKQLNRQLRQFGRYFPPDPSGASITTIGSMLALDAAGSHAIRVGSTRDHVQSLETVLADGTAFTACIESLAELEPLQTTLFTQSPSSRQELLQRVARLLDQNRDLIAQWQRPLIRNRFGYMLRGVLSDKSLNLPRMLVGSEGTLALFTGATLHTSPLPAARGVVLLLFGKLETAARVVPALSELEPSACDLLDRRLLTLAREADARFAELIPSTAEAALLVEHTAADEFQVADRLRLIVEQIRGVVGDAFLSHQSSTAADADFLWSLPETVVPLLARLPGNVRPLPFIEDVAIPPLALQEVLLKTQLVFQRHRVTATLYAHAATGQLHLRPILAAPTPETAPMLTEMAHDLYTVILEAGGTISGEHGAGLSRSAYLEMQYGPLANVFRELKSIFDPRGVLNPGKVIDADPAGSTSHLRPFTAAAADLVPLQLKWSPVELAEVAQRCNGCGGCRTQDPETRMCPLFRVDPREQATPRAKANLMRHIVDGLLPADSMTTGEFKAIADLCYNCKQCETECPSNVGISQLMIEAKAQYVATFGLTRAEWILSRANLFGGIGSSLSLAMNTIIGSPLARSILERIAGIAAQRKLPRFARRSFLRLAKRDLLSRPTRASTRPTVVYFVDHYANYHDPQLARSLVEILRHHRIPVHVPPGQAVSGMALVSLGDLEAARDLAAQNVSALAEFAREGSPIICTEPAAAICLKYEYPKLLDHPDVQTVADRVIDAGAFLLQLHREKQLRVDFQPLPIDVGYHLPCHVKTLSGASPAIELLSLIPELRLHRVNEGCSGMAGTFGLCSEHFTTSLKIGWNLISRMRSTEFSAGVTECSSCKLQMEQGTSTPTMHPLKLLALAYGLMPEIRAKLQPNRHRLFVT